MRILNLSAFYETHGGGIEIVAGQLARSLASRGHACTWAAAALDAAPQLPGIRALPLAARDPIERLFGLPMPLPSFAATRSLWREVRDHDAVIVHDALYASSLIALASARRWGKACVLIQHIGTIPYQNPLLKLAMAAADRLVTRPVLRRAAHPVFISDTVRSQFAGLRFRNPPVLLFNGVDSERFRPAAGAAERESLRTALGVRPDQQVVLFVGRMVEKKGLVAVRAMAAQMPQSLFVLVGSGPISPQAWNLPNVQAPGKLAPERLAELYRAADALVLPSVGEGYPLVVQEAMASGLPVLCGLDSAQADPAAARFLHGISVDPADPAGTANRFCAALSSLEPGPDRDAAAYARQTYNWAVNAARLEAMLAGSSCQRVPG